jgi:DNA-binding NarL/FixJ family response regulator
LAQRRPPVSEAVVLARQRTPDVVLMDVRMPEMDGIQATREICGSTSSRILMLTTFDLDEYVYGALQAGASGFLLKDARARDLLSAIRIVAEGDALIAPAVMRRPVAEFVRHSPSRREAGPSLDGVTDREVEVLVLVARGLSNGEIAERLSVSLATAKTHVARLLTKLQARDRAQLVVAAYETGLVRPSE